MKSTQQLAEMALEYGQLCDLLARPDLDVEARFERPAHQKRALELKEIFEATAK